MARHELDPAVTLCFSLTKENSKLNIDKQSLYPYADFEFRPCFLYRKCLLLSEAKLVKIKKGMGNIYG